MVEPMHEISLEGFIESFDRRYPTSILKTLLCDRTTGHNIIWADNEYEALGEGYMGDEEITVEKITGMNSGVIKPRIAKEQEKRSQRTKSRAEVFTPSWLCNQMNNDIDEAWFGRRDAFNTEIVSEDGRNAWSATTEAVEFPKRKGHGWHAYVEAPRLEITCGEAPFVCSRYDTVTGDELPVRERVGFLDRKLRVVTEKTKTRKEWVRRALDALRATYGFEFQGDNLLIARINVLETFAEHLRDRWESAPEQDELEQAARIVSWNFWQMNGFTDAVPTNKMGAEVESTLGTFEEPEPEPMQPSLFDLFDDMFSGEATEETKEEEPKETVPLCVIYDWQNGEPFEFATLKGKAAAMGMKFYAVIGNPPYQLSVTESDSGNKTYAPPIYHEFMDSAFKVSNKVELITPARFLFDAGSTPKSWNRKMLNDPHVKVMSYEADASKVFPNTDIKGGVAITYRDTESSYGAIGIFTAFPELTSLNKKAGCKAEANSLASIIYTQIRFDLSALYADHPDMKNIIGSGGKDRRFRNNIFDKVSLFQNHQSSDSIKVLGIQKNKRTYKYIDSRYVDFDHQCLSRWKVLVPRANGSGALGEVLSTPLIGSPLIGYTQSFIAIGSFDTELEAEACLKYIKSKFARTLLGILKITQDNDRGVWKYVPLQDFTSDSDIDWSQSVADIDRQLYAKYGLDDEEIQFIESHVKEMN
ncbi:Eco57I restriction-modification methylase domain-containing protein [Phoenicibacter congonensis]|uniref:Eco57I restriction-modification methylase domain-containing protein n=1 Tax=Phoenicibacter congonensis TaxID=1944646 RepID=UPI0018D49F18|nr:Eco57I restriction-modification methylase domain-containing protein [Phoenicibacter congonensis]